MKATLPRSEALKSKKAKAEPRPSGVMLKSKQVPAAPAKAPKSMSTPKANGGGKTPSANVTKSAPKPKVASKAAPKAAAPKAAPLKAAPLPSTSSPKAAPLKAAAVKATPSTKAAPAAESAKPRDAKAPAPSRKAASAMKSAKVAETVKPSAADAPPPPKKPARKSIKEAAGVSTDAVARRTGKSWDDWFEVLDSAGAATLDQRGIIAILAQKHGIGPWWQQMIAVGYESLRAKSDKPPAADGFQISETCTLSAPVARVFKLWNDASERARWLADDRFVVKSATPGKALRARWGKGNSQVAVSFLEKAGKTEVAVEHQHIESQSAADQMKAYWQKKLGLLDEALTQRA